MPSISNATLDSLTGKTDNATKKAGDTYNQFLILLTTQLQNQDPLDPMESAEFTNQLVQFSQVEQGILTNEKLDSLLSQASSNQISQSLSYIGKSVYYKGDNVYYTGDDMQIGYAIDGKSKSAKMRIMDADGQIVRTMEIQADNTSGSLVWDGKDDFGQAVNKNKVYTVRIDALDMDDKAISTYSGVPAHIEGVETLDGVLYLALDGGRRIPASNALSVSEKGTVLANTDNTGNTGDTGETDPDESDTEGNDESA